MAVYTTFFLCTPAELVAGFPQFKLPLPHPVKREWMNRFTKKLVVIETRAPEWPDESNDAPFGHADLVMIQGDYQDYLEGRLPSFVRQCPHWAAKGLICSVIEPLFEALGFAEELEDALYGNPSWGVTIEAFPPAFIESLPTLDIRSVAERWAAEFLKPEHTRQIGSMRLPPDLDFDAASFAVQKIVDLVRRRTAGQEMYLLTEA